MLQGSNHHQKAMFSSALSRVSQHGASDVPSRTAARHNAAVHRGGLAWVGLLGWCAACGSSPRERVPDAGTDAGPPPVVIPPASPAEPALPRLAPCEPWRETAGDDGIVYCEPWPETGPAACTAAEVHLPGAAGCEPIGVPCPSGPFADGLPAKDVLYVAAGASGGDGSRAAPFGRIADAVAAAGPATTIALAKGSYDEAVRLPNQVVLRGACVAETSVHSSAGLVRAGVIDVLGSDVTIRDLQVGPSAMPGIRVEGTGRRASLSGVLVVDTRYGVFAALGAELACDRVVVRGSHGSRMFPGSFGHGFDIETGAQATLTRVVSEDNETGFFAASALTRMEITDAYARHAVGGTGFSGVGVYVADGADATLTRIVAEANLGNGVWATGAGTVVRLDGILVRDTAEDAVAQGLLSDAGASLRGGRIRIERTPYLGAMFATSTVDLTDLIVTDSRTSSKGLWGAGMLVQDGTLLNIHRAALLRNQYAGLVSFAPGTQAVVEDLIVTDTAPDPSGLGGYGAIAYRDGALTVRRARLARNTTYGAWVERGRLVLEDVVVSETRSNVAGTEGNGLVVQSTARVTRALFRDNREIGIRVRAEGDLDAVDVVVEGTRERSCAATTCASEPSGHGIAAYGGYTQLQRFEVGGVPLCGLQIAGDGRLTAHDGTLRGNTLGLCAQSPMFDPARDTSAIRFEGNGSDVVTTGVPVSDVAPVPLD